MKKKLHSALLGLLLVLSAPVWLYAQTTETLTDTGKKIAILSFNDFHGAFVENKASNSPGIARMVTCIKTLQKKYAYCDVVSAGDNFAGSHFSKTTQAGIWADVRKELNVYIISALGNHEFDWGKDFLKKSYEGADFYYTGSNFIPDKDSGMEIINRTGWRMEYNLSDKEPFIVFKMGLMTRETKGKSGDRAGWFTVGDPLEILKDRKNDPECLEILLAHIGTQGGSRPAFMPDHYEKGKSQDVRSLATSKVFDAIVTGHSHNEVYGTIDGVPVVQAGCNGRNIGVIVFKIMKNAQGKIRFQYENCYLEPVAKYDPDPKVQQHVDKWLDDSLFNFREKLVDCAGNFVYTRDNLNQFMDIGGLVSYSYKNVYEEKLGRQQAFVFGITNAKGVRNGLSQGPVYRIDAGDVLPLTGELQAFKLTGDQFKKLIENGMNNPDGWIQTNNLGVYYKVKVNGAKRYNEVLGLGLILTDLFSSSYNVIRIASNAEVIVVIEKFLAEGNDGYDMRLFNKPIDAFNNLPAAERSTTEVFFNYLRGVKGTLFPFLIHSDSFREWGNVDD